jgi:hypothetical protein
MQSGGKSGGLVNPFSYFCLKVLLVKIFEFLAQYDYCEGLMIVVILIAFIFSLRHYGRHRALRIIPYYFAAWLLIEVLEYYRYITSPGGRFGLVLNAIAASFTVFEFCVFSLLVLHYITGARRRLAVKLNAVIFFIVEIFLYIRAFPKNAIFSMDLLEAAALVPLCVIYFYELFTNMNTKALKDRPSFWIVTGIIYQGVYNASLVLSMEYMGRFSNGAYAFSILFYCILFVLFMRAYKCNPEERVAA